jgi:hypothetical protein
MVPVQGLILAACVVSMVLTSVASVVVGSRHW